jgi:hypothetical protein
MQEWKRNCETKGRMNNSGRQDRREGNHAAADQVPACWILDLNWNLVYTQTQLTVCMLIADLRKIWLAQDIPERNLSISRGMSLRKVLRQECRAHYVIWTNYHVIRSLVIRTFSEPSPLIPNKHTVIEPQYVLIIVPPSIRQMNSLMGCVLLSIGKTCYHS